MKSEMKRKLLKFFRSKEMYGSYYDWAKLYECENGLYVVEYKYVSMDEAKMIKFEDLRCAKLYFVERLMFILS